MQTSFRQYRSETSSHHHADFHQIIIADHGQLDLEIDGRGGQVAGRRLAFVPAGENHAYFAQGMNRFLVLDVDVGLAAQSGLEHVWRRGGAAPYLQMRAGHEGRLGQLLRVLETRAALDRQSRFGLPGKGADDTPSMADADPAHAMATRFRLTARQGNDDAGRDTGKDTGKDADMAYLHHPHSQTGPVRLLSGDNRPIALASVEFSFADDGFVCRSLCDVLAHCGPADCRADHAILPDRLQRVLDWAELRLSDALSIADMARIAAQSESTLFAAFQRYLGTSPMRWLVEQRLLRAHALLSIAPLPGVGAGAAMPTLADIAAEVGFADQSAFSRAFSRRFGMAPNQYRRMARINPPR